MIQLNLLPDVKMKYIKAQRTRNMVLSTAVIITLASVALLVLLLVVGGLQKKHISDLNADIKTDSAQLKKQKDIEKILTVQNQLNRLTELHEAKPAAANLFGFLNEVTPSETGITNFKIDFTDQTITVTGTAPSLSSVNKYIDTLKYTKYSNDTNSDMTPAFKDVVLTSFSLSTGSQDPKKVASYTITMSYDPMLFDISKNVQLTVPKITTTRAQLTDTSDLFTSPVNKEGNQ